MTAAAAVEEEFTARLGGIRTHGLGLSVDVYSPDVISLMAHFRRLGSEPAYLEIFRAATTALTAVRRQLGTSVLTYHGEGLWLTQPEAQTDRVFHGEALEIAQHLEVLDSAWLNHECASKQIAGHTFGTYLPPLYTEPSADIVGDNARYIQRVLDQHSRLKNGASPLLLLEMAPLTYFATGTVDIPTFFRLVTEQVPCGLVLDIGHLWTVHRYSRQARAMSAERFVSEFLAGFPLERVVEIHVAGLAVHESLAASDSAPEGGDLPRWTDAHAAAIPPVLFDLLDQVLAHPKLTGLRGLALEVDTKSESLIIEEFHRFAERYAGVFSCGAEGTIVSRTGPSVLDMGRVSSETRHSVAQAYERYAAVLAGKSDPQGPEWTDRHAYTEELELYRTLYLPFEILHWGGELDAMFPATCRALQARAVPLARFVEFWFCEPRTPSRGYDFFLSKVERFVHFVRQETPDLVALAAREADELRHAYGAANEPSVAVTGP